MIQSLGNYRKVYVSRLILHYDIATKCFACLASCEIRHLFSRVKKTLGRRLGIELSRKYTPFEDQHSSQETESGGHQLQPFCLALWFPHGDREVELNSSLCTHSALSIVKQVSRRGSC